MCVLDSFFPQATELYYSYICHFSADEISDGLVRWPDRLICFLYLYYHIEMMEREEMVEEIKGMSANFRIILPQTRCISLILSFNFT